MDDELWELIMEKDRNDIKMVGHNWVCPVCEQHRADETYEDPRGTHEWVCFECHTDRHHEPDEGGES